MVQDSETGSETKKPTADQNKVLVKAFNAGGTAWTSFIGGEGSAKGAPAKFGGTDTPTPEQVTEFVRSNANFLDLSKLEENLEALINLKEDKFKGFDVQALKKEVTRTQDLTSTNLERQIKNDMVLIGAFNVGGKIWGSTLGLFDQEKILQETQVLIDAGEATVKATAWHKTATSTKKGLELSAKRNWGTTEGLPQAKDVAAFILRNYKYLDASQLGANCTKIPGMKEAIEALDIPKDVKQVMLFNIKPQWAIEGKTPQELAIFLKEHKSELPAHLAKDKHVQTALIDLQDITEEEKQAMLFNLKPTLLAERLGNDPQLIADFIKQHLDKLDLEKVGDFLSDPSAESVSILEVYSESLVEKYRDMEFAEALRNFVTEFKLPGESQKIDRLMVAFGKAYEKSHPGIFKEVKYMDLGEEKTYKSEDIPYVLAFSTIMLNTSLYNDAVKKKPTLERFQKDSKSLQLLEEFTAAIFTSISQEPFKMDQASSSPLRFDPKDLEDELSAAISSMFSPEKVTFNITDVIEERNPMYKERVEREAKENLDKKLLKAFNEGKDSWVKPPLAWKKK